MPPSSRRHILLVDDNLNELQLLLDLLRGADYRLSLAFDALQGYKRATALKPDLILLDVHMGAVDGFAACRLLKADPETARIPVILVSASGSLEERLAGLRGGAVDYVIKPFEPAEVLARIEVHLALAGRAPHAAEALPIAADDDASARGDRVLVKAAVQYLLDNLAELPTLASIAAKLGTHEKRLSRSFREHMGQTVFEFVREARLREAQRMLAQTMLRIDEVAREVGFANPANFATAFRERFGLTPSAFRDSAAKPLARADAA